MKLINFEGDERELRIEWSDWGKVSRSFETASRVLLHISFSFRNGIVVWSIAQRPFRFIFLCMNFRAHKRRTKIWAEIEIYSLFLLFFLFSFVSSSYPLLFFLLRSDGSHVQPLLVNPLVSRYRTFIRSLFISHLLYKMDFSLFFIFHV